MITTRPASERGHADHGWLDARHSFSFARYMDPAFMGYRSMRVLNEDRIQGGQGFGKHPHRDMEILTYVISGALEHADNTGGGGVIRRGDIQRMSAGTGIIHSEVNHDPHEPVHLLQIWLLPEATGLAPGYEQASFDDADRRGRLLTLAAPDGSGLVRIHQDARVYTTLLAAGEAGTHPLAAGRGAWIQVVGGDVDVAGTALAAGDGAAVEDVAEITLRARSDSEVVLFDLA